MTNVILQQTDIRQRTVTDGHTWCPTVKSQ